MFAFLGETAFATYHIGNIAFAVPSVPTYHAWMRTVSDACVDERVSGYITFFHMPLCCFYRVQLGLFLCRQDHVQIVRPQYVIDCLLWTNRFGFAQPQIMQKHIVPLRCGRQRCAVKRHSIHRHFLLRIHAASNAIPINRIDTATGIHNGDSTHNQDQPITPISFKTMKTIVSGPQKPIPAPLTFFSSFILALLLEFR